MYQSYQIIVPATGAVGKKPLFKTTKRDDYISQWTIIIQYLWLDGTPAPLPPPIVLGCLVNIIGLAKGIGGILNEVSASQTWVPLVGATYRAYGSEILIGFDNDAGTEATMLVSAIEEAPVIMDGESRFADPAVDVNIPQFATMFSVAVVSTGLRQRDSVGAALFTAAATPGVWYPLHPMAVSLVDTDAQLQIYSFKKGYT